LSWKLPSSSFESLKGTTKKVLYGYFGQFGLQTEILNGPWGPWGPQNHILAHFYLFPNPLDDKELGSEYLIVKTPPRDLSNGKNRLGKLNTRKKFYGGQVWPKMGIMAKKGQKQT
jgi:hypothetical protein